MNPDREQSARTETLALLDDLLGSYDASDFAVRLWDGTVWTSNPEASSAAGVTLVLTHPGSLRRALLRPSELGLAECYVANDIDIEGNTELLLSVGDWLLRQKRTLLDKLRLGRRLLRLPGNRSRAAAQGRAHLEGAEHSQARDRAAITHHYNVSNEFYRLWLDERMLYSCAMFASEDEYLDTAQERKLDMICRKLRLQPGEKLLEIGCGWGGLILHAAQKYGVEAHGITLSQPQADLANERIAVAGLADRCRAEVCDYRDLDASAAYDKLVSVGMVEHVGTEKLPQYFDVAWRLLKPGGAFLNHGIGDTSHRPPKKNKGFIRVYVFPDIDLSPINTILAGAEASGFEVRDVESLREHYTMTLRHWTGGLERRRQEAIREVGERTYRIWRLYLAACANWFEKGFISVYQALLAKPENGHSGMPLSREDWYR